MKTEKTLKVQVGDITDFKVPKKKGNRQITNNPCYFCFISKERVKMAREKISEKNYQKSGKNQIAYTENTSRKNKGM